MVSTRKGQAKPKNEPKTDSLSEKNEMFEQLKVLLAAETEKIENSNKRKFDEIAEKLESMGKSIAKISKTDGDEKKILSINRSNEKPESAKQFVLKSVFKNMSNFEKGDHVLSEDEEHFNVEWNVYLERNDTHLEFHVFCKPIVPVGDEWSIVTNVQLKMIGDDENNFIKTLKCYFDDDKGYGYEDFVEWEDIKNKYLIDGNLTVEVKGEIIKMTGFERKKLRLFDESQKDVSDVTLAVQDTKFYVSKTYLAAQSPFFKTLFFGNFSESDKTEIPLTGIEPEDFQCFLEALYGEIAIDDSTVEAILHIADMYDTPMVLRRCENFLLKESKKDSKEKSQISTQYRLEKLKV